MHPDVISCELSSMIGKGIQQAETYAIDNKRSLHALWPDILFVSETGLRTPEDLYWTVKEETDGSGGSSGIVCAEDMHGTWEAMIKLLNNARGFRQYRNFLFDLQDSLNWIWKSFDIKGKNQNCHE